MRHTHTVRVITPKPITKPQITLDFKSKKQASKHKAIKLSLRPWLTLTFKPKLKLPPIN